MMLVRTLVVEDFEPFRKYLRSSLQRRAEFQIVGEASDGLEAVQKAEGLQPDLILLDIGLPKLGGLEAARQIRALVPSAKILFVSQDSSPDVVEESFRVGGQGYVHKLRCGSDLLPAVEAVLKGERFVSQGLGYSLDLDSHYRHEVQFYSDESVMLETSTRFIADALKAGNAALVVATRSHQEALVQRLKGQGIDVDGAIRQGTYVSFDADEMLSRVMMHGVPDYVLFCEEYGGHIESAARATKADRPRVAILGEVAGLIFAEGNLDAAIRLEKYCNRLFERFNSNILDILCPYPMSGLRGGENDPAFRSICAEHTAVHSE